MHHHQDNSFYLLTKLYITLPIALYLGYSLATRSWRKTSVLEEKIRQYKLREKTFYQQTKVENSFILSDLSP